MYLDSKTPIYDTAFTPRQSASSVDRLANQRLHLARYEVSDWLNDQHSTALYAKGRFSQKAIAFSSTGKAIDRTFEVLQVRSNSWNAQLTVPNDPGYVRLETNLEIGWAKAMAPHIIIPAVGSVCCCKAKAGLRRSPRGLHTRTRLSSLPRLNLDSRVA
ncbi:hypothetical protein TNCV_528001 [Trichonephila clavipes]|nr:hypothetical protein TNCV_528001 [Trichonephila clavipes]